MNYYQFKNFKFNRKERVSLFLRFSFMYNSTSLNSLQSCWRYREKLSSTMATRLFSHSLLLYSQFPRVVGLLYTSEDESPSTRDAAQSLPSNFSVMRFLGERRGITRGRLFARVAAVPYIKLSVADVAGAYDTSGLVKRFYFSRDRDIVDSIISRAPHPIELSRVGKIAPID